MSMKYPSQTYPFYEVINALTNRRYPNGGPFKWYRNATEFRKRAIALRPKLKGHLYINKTFLHQGIEMETALD